MSTVAKKVLMGSGGGPEEWALEQSILFDETASLVRTPSSTGNRKKWTISVWVKRAKLGAIQYIYGGQSTNETDLRFSGTDTIEYFGYQSGALTWGWSTARTFRDVGAWYHIVAIFDSANSTQALRARLFVNGEEQSENGATSTAVSLNQDSMMNLAGTPQYIGRLFSTGSPYYYSGYMAEFHFLDGAATVASNFGETTSATGQWTPKEYEGSYGTNGFYLKFKSGAIGTDSSGEGNNYTATNLANADVVTDTPLNNFCTLNPLWASSVPILTEGNLKLTQASVSTASMIATIGVSAGKWYWEILNLDGNSSIGIANNAASPSGYVGEDANGWSYFISGTKYTGGTGSSYGASYTDDDIVGVALDMDAGTLIFYKNNVSQGTAFSSLSGTMFPALSTSGASHNVINVANFGQNPSFNGEITSGTATDGNSLGLFKYAPPSGYLALCTANLPDPAIALPTDHFNTALYNGNGSSKTVTTVGFQPGLTWIKNRSAADWHSMTDSNRGVQKTLFPNYGNNGDGTDTGPISGYEATYSDGLTAFNSNGFTVGSKNEFNTNNENFVSWNWKAGSNASNTDGTYTTTVSANQTAGFSIVTYTGQGYPGGSQGTYTFGHGLSEAPTFILIKKRAGGTGNTAGPAKGGSWVIGASAIDPNWTGNFYLNATNAYYNANGSATNYFWAADPTSSLISLYYDWFANGSSTTYVAYCFHDVPGYSKIGTYTGNGSADGPFIFTGFKPAWVMYKKASGSTSLNLGRWTIEDNKRDPFNEVTHGLFANRSDAENTGEGYWDIDFLSNGFKLRTTEHETNDNGATFFYMAFAESPFKTGNAR
jgi:hypothetical protein